MESGSLPTIAVAVLSVIGTMGVTYFGHRLGLSKEMQLRQTELDRSARYLAIRVVCRLDKFVSECCEVVDDDGLSDQDGIVRPRVAAPTISFPDDVDWKAIDPDLMYRLISFPNELDSAENTIIFVSEHVSGPPDYREYFEERIIQYGKLGLAALALTDELRGTYNIPVRNYGDWHPKDTLNRILEKE